MKSVWPVDGTVTGTTTLDHSGLGSNGNEWITRHKSEPWNCNFTTGFSLLLYSGKSYPSLENAASVFSAPMSIILLYSMNLFDDSGDINPFSLQQQ